MKEMLHYLKPYWRGLLAATIAVAISTVCDLLLPAIMSEILNKGVYRADFAYIVRCCAVMAAGALVLVDGVLVPMNVSVGQHIIVSKYAGTEIKVDGVDMLIVRQSDILAVVE